MSNPIAALEHELQELELQHPFHLARYGTREHPVYRTSEPKDIIARKSKLREGIEFLRKRAGLRHKTSSIAHGGRRMA